jgi:hypothetical protein
VGGGSGEEGGELGGEEDNGVEGETSAIIGPEGGSIGKREVCQEKVERIYPPSDRSRRWDEDRKDASHQT